MPEAPPKESFKSSPPRPIDDARAKEIDAFVAKAREDLEVPGAVVAVIANGAVVYEKALGARKLGDRDELTARTLFMIGSITKPMTTMMEATLVDAGTFAWDTPVTKLLPTFAVDDASLTKQLVMWHMSCACTGMPRQDMEDIFEFANVTPEQRLASMSKMKPTSGIGEKFQYSNLMVAAGGFAAARAFAPRSSLGAAYDQAMKKKVFEPIGMDATTLDFAAAERADHAMPHALDIDGVPHTIPLAEERDVLTIAPAGAVWTSARDLERFVITELANGVSPDGKRVVSEANLLERRKPRIATGDHSSYGLGLDIEPMGDLPTISHDGGSFGFGASILMFTDQKIGIVVLTNIRNGSAGEQLPFNAVVKRKIIEEIFAGASNEAQSMVERLTNEKRENAKKAVENLERDPEPQWVKGLTGTYFNPSLGKVTIGPAAKGGVLDAGEWKSAFGRRKVADGTVQIVMTDPPFAGGETAIGSDGGSPTLIVKAGPNEYVFKRTKR